MNQSSEISNNVQSVIDQLHEEGVVAGQTQGKKIVEDAEARAQWILDQAKQQAEQILNQAKAEAHVIHESALSALKLASRDLLLTIKAQLQDHLAAQLEQLIGDQLAEREFMISLLTEAIEQQWFTDNQARFLVPERILDLTDISNLGAEAENDPLLPAIRKLTQRTLEKGIQLESQKDQSGLRIELNQGQVEIITDEKTLADWLLQFVHPRFRALIDGVIR